MHQILLNESIPYFENKDKGAKMGTGEPQPSREAA